MTVVVVNQAVTELAAAMDASQNTADLVDGSLFPTTDTFYLAVGGEIMTATGRTANQLTGLTRGVEGTTAAAHTADSPIANVLTAASLQDLIDQSLPAVPAVPQIVTRTAGNLTGTTGATFVELSSALRLTIPAVAGDLIALVANFSFTSGNRTYLLDAATIVSAAIVNRFAAGTGGVPGWQGAASVAGRATGTYFYVVQSGDLSAGNVTVSLANANATTGGTAATVNASSGTPLQLALINYGQ